VWPGADVEDGREGEVVDIVVFPSLLVVQLASEVGGDVDAAVWLRLGAGEGKGQGSRPGHGVGVLACASPWLCHGTRAGSSIPVREGRRLCSGVVVCSAGQVGSSAWPPPCGRAMAQRRRRHDSGARWVGSTRQGQRKVWPCSGLGSDTRVRGRWHGRGHAQEHGTEILGSTEGSSVAVAHAGSTRALGAGRRRSPWVDGVGVAGVTKARGPGQLVVAVGNSASISGLASLCLWSSTWLAQRRCSFWSSRW